MMQAIDECAVEQTSAIDEASVPEDPKTSQPIPNARLKIASAGIDHLSTIVHQLVELWQGPDRDEYGILQPTKEAFDAAVELLVDAAIEASREARAIPLGCATTDCEGGVRVEWIRDAGSVHLVVPASGADAAYVYHEFQDAYATEDATPQRLIRWLRHIP